MSDDTTVRNCPSVGQALLKNEFLFHLPTICSLNVVPGDFIGFSEV